MKILVQSIARNPNICGIFHETKDMEELGTGIDKMKEFMHNYGLQEPEFRLYDNSFAVIFYGPGDNILDLASNVPDNRKIDLKELELNDRQIKALELMINEEKIFTNSLYQETFKISDRTASRDLKGLVDKNLVYATGKRKNRKYKALLNSG